MDKVPEYAVVLATRSCSINGTNIIDPSISAISSALTPIIHSIQIAKHGIKIDKHHISLPPSIKKLYSSWKSSDDRMLLALQKHLPSLMEIAIHL